jgi:hypothetical protein
LQVILLGGSITAGVGASEPSRCYAQLFAKLLNVTFPHRDHTVLNKGIGACSSDLFAACVERMVPPDTDLVVCSRQLAVQLLCCTEQQPDFGACVLTRTGGTAGLLPVC